MRSRVRHARALLSRALPMRFRHFIHLVALVALTVGSRVAAQAPASESAPTAAQPAEVEPGGLLCLVFAGRALRLVSGVTVALGESSAVTDRRGSAFVKAPAGSYRVQITRPAGGDAQTAALTIDQ